MSHDEQRQREGAAAKHNHSSAPPPQGPATMAINLVKFLVVLSCGSFLQLWLVPVPSVTDITFDERMRDAPEFFSSMARSRLKSFAPFSPRYNFHDPCHPLPRSSKAKKLELLHVPKTGGTALEVVAARSGITWGCCHWQSFLLDPYLLDICPKDQKESGPLNEETKKHAVPWHRPLDYLDIVDGGENPYRNAQVFIVVRDPYKRMVSQFNYLQTTTNATIMNQYLMGHLMTFESGHKGSREYFVEDGHFIPQYDYAVNHDGLLVVLRQENLKADFACLTHQYYPWDHKMIVHDHEKKNIAGGKLTPKDLSSEVKRGIERIYKDDFEAFGYDYLPDDENDRTNVLQ